MCIFVCLCVVGSIQKMSAFKSFIIGFTACLQYVFSKFTLSIEQYMYSYTRNSDFQMCTVQSWFCYESLWATLPGLYPQKKAFYTQPHFMVTFSPRNQQILFREKHPYSIVASDRRTHIHFIVFTILWYNEERAFKEGHSIAVDIIEYNY